MNDRQTRSLHSYERILAGFRDLGATIAPEAPNILERLERTVAHITMFRDAQWNARSDCNVTTARFHLEKMRREQMLPLARLTRRLFAGESAIEAALRVPHKRAPTPQLLAASALMIASLRPHRAFLAESHIDPTRIDQLQSETRRLKKLFIAAYALSADRAAPTRRLPDLFASARDDVLALDALHAAREEDASGIVWSGKVWKSIRRVGKHIGRPRAPRLRAAPK